MKRDYYRPNDPVHFEFPLDGDCLNIRDGFMKDGYLTIKVKVQAPVNADICIDEQKAAYEDGYYTLEVPLRAYRTTIVAENRTTGYQTEIAVYKLKDCMNKYRISLDDNILFLADITKNKDTYSSIFDNPYLAVYKKAHDLYGAAVHLNLFFAHIPENNFSSHREYFDLTMMTDKFKDEFINNSHWLKLSFHAYSEFPDMPYKNTAPEVILEHAVKANREIVRFAGKEIPIEYKLERILSLDSATALSGNPTILNEGIPFNICTWTSTSTVEIPKNATVFTHACKDYFSFVACNLT